MNQGDSKELIKELREELKRKDDFITYFANEFKNSKNESIRYLEFRLVDYNTNLKNSRIKEQEICAKLNKLEKMLSSLIEKNK